MAPRPAKRAKLSDPSTPIRTKSQKKKSSISVRKKPSPKTFRELLDVEDTPFVIKQGHRVSQSSKTPAGFRLQYHPFFDEDVAYAIELNEDPKQGFAEWDKLSHHTKALVPDPELVDEDASHVPFRVGDLVYVRNDRDNDDCKIKDWVGYILQIAAWKDIGRVWVRVWWFLRPEDLPGGRQPHHGDYEVFPSTCMEIVDIETVNYLVESELHHIQERDLPVNTGDDLFWRQTFDFVQQRLEPKIGKHCNCNQHVNPTEPLIRCQNDTCTTLLHERCILDAAVKGAYRKSHPGDNDTDGDAADVAPSATRKSNAVTDAHSSPESKATDIFSRVRSYLSIPRSSSEKPQNDDQATTEKSPTRTKTPSVSKTPRSKSKLARKLVPCVDLSIAKKHFNAQLKPSKSGSPRLQIKPLQGKNKAAWEQDVQCLICGNTIE